MRNWVWRSDKEYESKHAFACFGLGLRHWFAVDTSRRVSDSTDRDEV